MSPWGEGGRQGRKPQANSDPQPKHRGSVLLHPEHPKYKEGVAPTTAPVTPRFSKTERREILSGSQQITTAKHTPQYPSHQGHMCSFALRCQVTFKVPGQGEQQDGGGHWPPGGGTHHSHTQHRHQPQSPHQRHIRHMATQSHALPAPNIIPLPHTHAITRHHNEHSHTSQPYPPATKAKY